MQFSQVVYDFTPLAVQQRRPHPRDAGHEPVRWMDRQQDGIAPFPVEADLCVRPWGGAGDEVLWFDVEAL